jgi:threonine synthase
MELTIEQSLGDRWAMFYHPQWPIKDLLPVSTIEDSIERVNRQLQNSRDLKTWGGQQHEAASLLWVNWTYQRLVIEPIRKPVLVHEYDTTLMVDSGDTGLMSLSLLSDPGTVRVVVTVPKEHSARYIDWQQIHTNQDLITATGFRSDANILLRQATGNYAVEWLEIGDQTTSHHLHNVDQRIDMLQAYIDEQTNDFKFSKDWARSCINWDNYIK